MPNDQPPGDPNPGGRGERLGIAAVDRRVTELADRVDQIAEQLDGYQAPLASLHNKLDELLGARRLHWPDLDDAERARRWPDLMVWVSDVLSSRHPVEAARVRPCWWRHPDAVDDMTALWLAWVAAYRDVTAPAVDMAAWRTRWLPDLLDRLIAATAGCGDSHHAPEVVDLAAGAPEECP